MLCDFRSDPRHPNCCLVLFSIFVGNWVCNTGYTQSCVSNTFKWKPVRSCVYHQCNIKFFFANKDWCEKIMKCIRNLGKRNCSRVEGLPCNSKASNIPNELKSHTLTTNSPAYVTSCNSKWNCPFRNSLCALHSLSTIFLVSYKMCLKASCL